MVKWYTRYLEVVVLARAWRFKSSHPHHKACGIVFYGHKACWQHTVDVQFAWHVVKLVL